MSTRSKKKVKKKHRRRLQLRSRHRRSTKKTQRKSIGLKSQQILQDAFNKNSNTLKSESMTSSLLIPPHHHTSIGETKQMTQNTANSSQISSIATSHSSTVSPPSSASTVIRINKKTSKRRKNCVSQIGVNRDQLKRQQNARINKKNKAKLAKTINKNKILKISAGNINNLPMNDILPMRMNIKIESSIHILNNLGKHKIHIHNKEKMKISFGLLRINGNIEQFKYLMVDDILSINDNLTLKISYIDRGGATNWHLSIDSMISKEYNITPHTSYSIRHINPLSLELSQIEVCFKNQYISRGALWKIERDLVSQIVHVDENIKCSKKGYDLNIKQMKSLAKKGENVSCGLITPKTKFLFRSNSSWIIYLVQLSKEMWDFNKNQIHFETFIDGFLKTIMTKWKQNECNHVYSIIFFSRTFYDYEHVKNMSNHFNKSRTKVFNKDSDNRYYQDHYMVVVRNWNTNDWNKLSKKLREAFDLFPRRVKWKRNINKISVASEGNLLEAIQLALNVVDKHYIDRDLYRTGMSITVVTAGTGHYFVDKSLATFTKVRILNNGVNCDIVSMNKPPLHPTPLFIYGSPLAFEQNKWDSLSYYQPTEMMQIKFFSYNPYNEQRDFPREQLYTKVASFLEIKNASKTFVPLPLGEYDSPQNIDINNDFYNIYLQNDWNNKDGEDYDDDIFAPITFDDYDIKPKKSKNKKRKLQAAIYEYSPMSSSVSISPNLPPRFTSINKRAQSLFSALSANKLSNRMLGGNTSSGSSDDEEEELVDDVINEPNVGTLKAMFMASKQDGDDINDDPQPPDVVEYSDVNHIIVIGQSNSFKNTTISALDPSNTPCLIGSVDADKVDEFKLNNSSPLPPIIPKESSRETTFTPREIDSDVIIEDNEIHPFCTKWNNNVNERNKRFGQIYPLPHQYCGFLFPSYNKQWVTFISPAILPLTNDTDFNQDMLEGSKNVYKSNRQIGVRNTNNCLLNEMVVQRLTQDFQLMRMSSNDGDNNIRIHVLNTQTYIHKLTHISNDPNISITRYVDNRLADKESNILYNQMQDKKEQKEPDLYRQITSSFSKMYNYNLWNDHRETFQNHTVKLAEQHQLYDWTKLDQVCGGYSDDIENDLKARRIRFVLIPRLKLNEREEMIKNFIKWFTKITARNNIKECGIHITNMETNYDPETWNHSLSVCMEDNNSYQIGFDSMNEIKNAKRLKIELKSEWKQRKTFLIIKYDPMYDPNIVFHFEIYWLIATGNQISKFTSNIKKYASTLNLHLISVPSAQPINIADPFSKTLTVESQTKILNKNVKIHLQKALINKFKFILDTNTNINTKTAIQFMHCDGCAIVRWHNGGFLNNAGFTWVPNNEYRKQSIQLFRDYRKYFHETIAKYIHIDEIIDTVIIKNAFKFISYC